jgi:hypothetical protein
MTNSSPLVVKHNLQLPKDSSVYFNVQVPNISHLVGRMFEKYQSNCYHSENFFRFASHTLLLSSQILLSTLISGTATAGSLVRDSDEVNDFFQFT